LKRFALLFALCLGGCDVVDPAEMREGEALVREVRADALVIDFHRRVHTLRGDYEQFKPGQHVTVRYRNHHMGNGVIRIEILHARTNDEPKR
jgi:hypothetical protein